MTCDYYYNTSWQCLEIRKDQTAETPNVYKQYAWDLRYIDAPLCRDTDGDADGDCTETDWSAGNVTDEHLYYCQDANFNVTALVRRGDGTVLERYLYDPYGKTTFLAADWSLQENGDTDGIASNYDNEVLFCGYRFDPETALNHVRYRMYHPTLGRWMQRDPAGYGGTPSLCEYCLSNPSLHHDPQGLMAMTEGERLTTLGEVRLHSEVLTRHGTTEGYEKSGDRHNLFMIPNEYDKGAKTGWLAKNVWYNFWSQDSTYIAITDIAGPNWFTASFHATTWHNPKYNLRLSANIRVAFEIENVCCVSGALHVSASCNRLKNVFCEVPTETVYYVQVGEKMPLPIGQEARLGSDWRHERSGKVEGQASFKYRKKMQATGSLYVQVRCVANL